MKQMTADELRTHALRTGAEVVIDGKPFNTARAQVQVAKSVPKPAPAPAVPQQATFTRAEVEQMLAEHETRVLDRMLNMVGALKAPEEEADEPGMCAVGFTPKYNPDGSIAFVGVQYERLQ